MIKPDLETQFEKLENMGRMMRFDMIHGADGSDANGSDADVEGFPPTGSGEYEASCDPSEGNSTK